MSEAINNVKQAFDAELAQTDLTNQEAVNNLRVKKHDAAMINQK